MRLIHLGKAATLALLGLAYPAFAQAPTPQAPTSRAPTTPAQATPTQATPTQARPTQATPTQAIPVQAWVSSCRGEGPTRVCDTVQSLVDTTTQREVVRVAFAKQTSSGRIGILIKTPLGLRLDTGAMLRLNGVTEGSIEGLAYSRCLADGCYAEKPLSTAEVTKIKNATTIDVLLLNLQGGPVAISITTNGLTNALNGL